MLLCSPQFKFITSKFRKSIPLRQTLCAYVCIYVYLYIYYMYTYTFIYLNAYLPYSFLIIIKQVEKA